ncbi:Protein kinase C-like [Zalerion maritima]|uniref:Protein kinase C-like n=1 Tax=Zalerion maritima TaxID=339359 RepID=A0AAD5RIT6_9PEZI|nr:Protein kinase C-like [Zalerion maritima]
MNEEDAIRDIYKKIEREKALIQAANMMRGSTDNPAVRSRLDSQMRDGTRNITFFEQRLQELQQRMSGISLGGNDGPTPPPKDSGQPWSSSTPGGYGGGDLGAPRQPFAGGQGGSKPRPNFSKLDLIKYDSPYLGPRIQLMLSQIQFKLNVEKQYLKGVEKMVQLYSMEGDRKSKADAAARKVESSQKIVLLKQALKRYEELHIDFDSGDAGDDDSISSPNLRKPLTGQLSVRVVAIKDVDHAAISRFSRGPETFVAIKVEDNVVARTRVTRSDRWENEQHSIEVDKANEIELTCYDKPGEHPIPIGMLWVRISDIVEEMRRKKIEAEVTGKGWVSADRMGNPPPQFPMSPGQGGQFGQPTQSVFETDSPPPTAPSNMPAMPLPQAPIDAWFNLEPAGQIRLHLAFVKHSKDRRPLNMDGLGRKGAVRQRKEEVHEMYGHKFVQHQFYNVMRCALCGDFLKYSAGMQCEDCKYTCHTKCYGNVVTKCISKSNAETDPDEEKINHRIPHRFAPFSNMTANWCCHCGYLLPFGKKNCRKCSECGLTCHSQCQHLVPDFCGMSMVVANQILEGIRTQKQRKAEKGSMSNLSGKTLRPGSQATIKSSNPSIQHSPGPFGQSDSPYGRPPASHEAKEAAQAMYGVGPQSPTQRPMPPDRTQTGMSSISSVSTTSSPAAAAAANAAMTGGGPGQHMGGYGDPGYGQPPPSHGGGGGGGYGGYDQQDPYGSPQRQQPPQQQNPQHPKYNPAAYAQVNVTPPQQIPVQQQQPQQQPMQPPPHQQPFGAMPQKPIGEPQPIAPLQTSSSVRKPLPSATDPGTGQRIGLDHFNFLAVLGKGNFGKVMLAETKRSKQLYAIKVLKKEFIIENDEVESIRSEKRVFLIANRERHPFLTSLHACFQTETRVYFVMEYISGGDLMLHIQRGQFGTKRAKFYAAEVCLALKYFHENGVIYRDLKLDNILLTLDGHIKIADFGLCKEDMWYASTTSTFCGTPEFMAPEILLDKKYGRAVDWWAFGVLIYQMLLQQSPFRGEDEDEIYDAILGDEPLYPIQMPRDSVSILQKLLTREPDQRLGSGPTDAQEVMSQPFFRDISWDDIYHKRVAPPMVPHITSATDTSNFDSEFTSVTPVLTPVQSVLSQAMQEEFRGFSYTADFD